MRPPIAILRIYRGISYFLNYLFLELPRGLNISPRSKTTGITLQGNHGYALTSRAALKNMLNGIHLQNQSFLDVGSGKGGVIIYSHELGCVNSAGIEYEKSLHDIAVKNIEKLKLSSYCTSYNIDARNFKSYADFDILFMFNPFDDDIYESVIKEIRLQILEAKPTNTKYLICYGNANIDAVHNSGIFSLIREDYCPYRGNSFRVFKFDNHD
jgi:16S rRNA G966 N2-methylase RsmD